MKWSPEETGEGPPGVTTVTFTALVPAGLVAVICVAELTVKPLAGAVPKSTAVAPRKARPCDQDRRAACQRPHRGTEACHRRDDHHRAGAVDRPNGRLDVAAPRPGRKQACAVDRPRPRRGFQVNAGWVSRGWPNWS